MIKLIKKEKWAAFVLAAILGAAALSGCQKREPLETKPGTESSVDASTEREIQTETDGGMKEGDQAGQPALRDAKVMTGGRIYAWVYDVDFEAAPKDYVLAGTVASIAEGTMPEADWEAVGLKEGDSVYIREDGISSTIFVESEGAWSAFIPYEDVASAYEYSKEPWVYQTLQKEGGFSITLPDGSWQEEAQGDFGIDSLAGKGGRVDIIHMEEEEAREVFPYIDSKEECRELILNTGVSSEFELAGFEAGLADSDTDPEASYYFAEIVYTEEADYKYELRYALYCGGHYWQVQVLMKENTRKAAEKAAGIVESFTVATCKSPSIVLRYEGFDVTVQPCEDSDRKKC